MSTKKPPISTSSQTENPATPEDPGIPKVTEYEKLPPPELFVNFSNGISETLLYHLSRKHLDTPIDDNEGNYFKSVSSFDEVDLKDFYFLRLEQVGIPASAEDLHHKPFTALQTALASCHNPDRYTLVFIVSNDGKKSHIYIGVRSHNRNRFSSQAFAKYLGNFLQGNWKGTKFETCAPDADPIFKEKILEPLKKIGYGVALTGIPSVKETDEQAYPQSLDRLISGMRGSPFMYMVIAEPMARNEVDKIIRSLRELMGKVHAISKIDFNKTFNDSLSKSSSNNAQPKVINKSVSKQSNKAAESLLQIVGGGVGGSLVTAGGVVTGLPIALFFGAAIGIATFGKIFFTPKQETLSTSDSYTSSSKTNTSSAGNTFSYGKEYISFQAQATEELLKRYVERFEQARASGCWNVGAYFLSDNPSIAQQGGLQLGGLLSGEKSYFEPVRIHDLESLWIKEKVRDSLIDLVQPNLLLVTPKYSKDKFISSIKLAQKKAQNEPENDPEFFDRLETSLDFKVGETLDHLLGKAFNGLTTPINTEELSLLINFPQREISGVKAMPTAPFSLNPPNPEGRSIVLGRVLEDGEPTPLSYKISLDSLSKHGLISGITGSGKSTTCFSLLKKLSDQKVPFLIIEPAKDEYVEWARNFNSSLDPQDPDDKKKRISIYIPGLKNWRDEPLEQLKLNPLDFIWLDKNSEPNLLSHLDRFKSILSSAFSMQEVLPLILEDVLFRTYKDQKWFEADINTLFDTPRPKLSNLRDLVDSVVREKNYEDRIRQNIIAALQTRINSLLRGWKKDLFDQPSSTPWEDLFDRPVVINLSHMGDDGDKAFTMSILLQFLYEYRQAQHELVVNNEERQIRTLRHLTLVEEAHRILLKPMNSGNLEQSNPQAKVAEMFANILSEVRAYGEGMLIVDQVPSRLIPDAIKNTNLKIVHRLVAADDRDAMGASMALSAEQSAIINRLRPGQAIVYGDLDDLATWIEVVR